MMKHFTQDALRLELIAGHEYEKRAVEIALIGNHPIVFLVNKGSNVPQLLITANRIAHEQQITFKGLAYFWCPCGNYGHPKEECRCNIATIEKHLGKLAKEVNKYDIWCQSNVYPKQYHIGEVEEVFVERVRRGRKIWREVEKKLKKTDMPIITPDSPSSEIIRYYQGNVSDKLDVHRVMRLARTIAYQNNYVVQQHHLSEALQYQPYTMAGLQEILEK